MPAAASTAVRQKAEGHSRRMRNMASLSLSLSLSLSQSFAIQTASLSTQQLCNVTNIASLLRTNLCG